MSSLSDVTESLSGQPTEGQHFHRGCHNWYVLISTLEWKDPPGDMYTDVACNGQYAHVFSESHMISIYLLREWWKSSIIDSALSSAVRTALSDGLDAYNQLRQDGGASQDSFAHGIEYTKVGFEISKELLNDTLLEQSAYHRHLFFLWVAEFCIVDHPMKAELLNQHRSLATIAASSQRIAWNCFGNILSSGADTETFSDQQQLNFLASTRHSLLNAMRILPTTVPHCPWLRPRTQRFEEDNINGLPHYLWDVEARKTVIVQQLPTRPVYMAISHSWGRWTRKDCLPIAIEGVPWLTQPNTLFNVARLPDDLLRAFRAGRLTPYIWIDLFCMPSWHVLHRAHSYIRNVEICRQMEIFRGASEGIIWFPNAPDWNVLETSILWMAAHFLDQSQGHLNGHFGILRDLLDSLMTRFEKDSDGPTNLFKPYEYYGETSVSNATQVGWFTSLWAMQEMYFRPDMRLVDRNWRPLCVGPENLIITLESLVLIAEGYDWLVLRSQRWGYPTPREQIPDRSSEWHRYMPRGVAELLQTVKRSNLRVILEPRPLHVSSMIDARSCLTNRIVATMPATGSIKWYLTHLADHFRPPRMDDGVINTFALRRFPLQYLKEFRELLGAQFFSTERIGGEHCVGDIYSRSIEGSRIGLTILGSLLPFSKLKDRMKREWRLPLSSTDHPSVSGWEVLSDGTCSIKQVAIVALHEPKGVASMIDPGNHPQLDSSPLLFRGDAHRCCLSEPREPTTRARDLAPYLRARSPLRCVYAVTLSHGPLALHHGGVILQGVLLNREGTEGASDHAEFAEWDTNCPGAQLLVKIGTFRLIDTTPLGPFVSTEVNWRVL